MSSGERWSNNGEPQFISHEQLRMIQSRLEALHAAQLLGDDEFFVLEDLSSERFYTHDCVSHIPLC